MAKDLQPQQIAALPAARDVGDALGARVLPETVTDLRRIMTALSERANADLPDIAATVHESVPMDDGLTGMVVAPPGEGACPVLCFPHGGGRVCGSPRDHRKLLLRFAEGASFASRRTTGSRPSIRSRFPSKTASRGIAGRQIGCRRATSWRAARTG